MKKLLACVAFSSIITMSLSADYMLVLTDKDGNQTQECVKSYSFSNNLESLAKRNSVSLKDVYSEEETMTNKVYLGKPVYRKIVTIPSNLKINSSWSTISYLNSPENLEFLISAVFLGASYSGVNERQNYNYKWNNLYMLGKTFAYGHMGAGRVVQYEKRKVVLEYTKTTDTVDSSSNTFKSYLHYVPSSADNEEVITKDMKNLGVQFLEGYTYDSSISSCIKN
ncbi:hypothetical protein ACMC56_03600 [Campylobacterota bacterium DY0563]